MASYVNIITSDRGWILERLARAIADRLPYVRYGKVADPGAYINYYMTYSCRERKTGAREVGFFTHLETEPHARALFFQVAAEMDHCICMSRPYESLLRENGIVNATAIKPGVDLSRFTPGLNIGVIGRSGDAPEKSRLIQELRDLNWIDWRFSGSRPGTAPASFVAAADPSFYNQLDYLLIYQSQKDFPLEAAEAVACGIEIIAPDDCCLGDLPRISYAANSVQALRRLLHDLFDKKRKHAKNVAGITWDAWAEGHDRVFNMLAAADGVKFSRDAARIFKERQKIVLALHGDENVNRGGPSTRVPVFAELLGQTSEFDPYLRQNGDIWPKDAALGHVFNLWKLETCQICVMSAWRYGQPVVLSPIFLDLSENGFFTQIQRIFESAVSELQLGEELSKAVQKRRNEIANGLRYRELFPGQYDGIRAILEKTDHVIFLSENERRLFEALDLPVRASSIVHNPVNFSRYADADPQLFGREYGVKDYILCVGRLEPRKNQLLLAYALRNEDLTLVFLGHGVDEKYRALIRKYGPEKTIFVDRLPPGSDLLASAYAGARVFCLPSWAEGASLSALEAGAAGCAMVLGNRSSEQEYFGEYARYCDPIDPESIKSAVLEAWNNPLAPEQKAGLRKFVADNYSWRKHIEATEQVYREVLSQKRIQIGLQKATAPKLCIDLSTCARHKGPPMGMARVENFYARDLLKNYPGEVTFTLWNEPNGAFIPVETWQFLDGSFRDLAFAEFPLPHEIDRDYDAHLVEEGSDLLVIGGVWTFTQPYLASLRNLVRDNRLRLSAFIHDLIPVKLSCYYPPHHRRLFIDNTRILLTIASRIFADSRSGMKDITEFCAQHNLACPPIDVVRLGDYIDADAEGSPQALETVLDTINGEPFVLFVSDLNIRKNHAMMMDIWRRMIHKHGSAKTPQLVCVGKMGLQGDRFMDLMEREELLHDRLHLMSDIEDGTLAWLYRNCLFTVYPSQYEGWGLPVAESLAYGKVTLASKISSIPEIAPEYTDLIPPDDFIAWEKAIESYIFDHELRREREKQISAYSPLSWNQSAKMLLGLLERPAPNPVDYPSCEIGARIQAARNTQYLGAGWSITSKQKLIGKGPSHVIIANLWLKAESCVFVMRCRALQAERGCRCSVRVDVNGASSSVINIAGYMQNYRVDLENLPRPARGFTPVKISLHVEAPKVTPIPGIDEDIVLELEQFYFEPVALPLSRYEESFTKIAEYLGLPHSSLQHILDRRWDLRSIIAKDAETGPYEFLFWAWRYGAREEMVIRKCRKRMERALRAMAATRHSPESQPGFSRLAYAIWLTRPDLKIFDISAPHGQLGLIQWLLIYGIKEYNLEEIMQAPAEFRDRNGK